MTSRRKIVVSHSILGAGGAERVLASILQVAHRMGFETRLITGRISKFADRSLKDQSKKVLPSWAQALPKTIVAILTEDIALRTSSDSDIVINTAPLKGPFFRGDILYLHYPYFFSELLLSKSLLNKLFGLGLLSAKRTMDSIGAKSRPPKLILFNSHYTMRVTEKLCSSFSFRLPGLRQVVYPPVDAMNIFKRVRALNKAKKPDMVLTISRFDPSKNVERILDIATATNSNVKFKVVGAAESYSYVYALKRRINELHLSERVSIETNISETRKIEHLATSSMYLHPMLGEHFGISILEAMASGCIPCAPKIGGPSEVIPSKFLYRSTEEAAAIIDNYADYSNSALRDFLVSSSFEYDKSIFEGRIRQIIESI